MAVGPAHPFQPLIGVDVGSQQAGRLNLLRGVGQPRLALDAVQGGFYFVDAQGSGSFPFFV